MINVCQHSIPVDIFNEPSQKLTRHGMGGSELMRFKGKVAVITAAASGICRAAAGIIAKEGGRGWY